MYSTEQLKKIVGIREERERRHPGKDCCAAPAGVPAPPPDTGTKIKNSIKQVVEKINDEAHLMRIYKFIVRLYMK